MKGRLLRKRRCTIEQGGAGEERKFSKMRKIKSNKLEGKRGRRGINEWQYTIGEREGKLNPGGETTWVWVFPSRMTRERGNFSSTTG